jgi:OOP family OmpA-OmpF porin
MKKTLSTVLIASLIAAGCAKKQDDEQKAMAEAALNAAAPTGPATMPTIDAPALPQIDAPAKMATVSPDFDASSVPVTGVALPPFPFFKDPEGLENDLKGPDALKSFDRQFFIAGDKLVAHEGRLALSNFNIEAPVSGRKYSVLEFHRNYENAIAALGGKRISTAQYGDTLLAAAGGRDAVEKYLHGALAVPDAETYSYLIRTPDKEFWIYVSAGGQIPQQGFVQVLEKQAMQSSLAFLDANAMKKELDAKGFVALYINFDTDKATLRADAQPVIGEVNKLLIANPSLKLSIEGHTDNVGGADHNRQLATSRARSVLGALVGLGIDAGRLSSKGFGPDKPIADNSTDSGRAKNRRVELVKVN